MSMLLRMLFVGSGIALLILLLLQPTRLRLFGRRAMVVAYAYVAAILISAFVRFYFGWGT